MSHEYSIDCCQMILSHQVHMRMIVIDNIFLMMIWDPTILSAPTIHRNPTQNTQNATTENQLHIYHDKNLKNTP